MRLLNRLARMLGALCGAALSIAWVYAIWVPAARLSLSNISVVVALLLVVFALFATIASLKGHATVVMLLFLASFFPIGAFVLPTDHWLHWVGWVDLGLLAAAIVMWVTRRSRDDLGAQAADDAR